MAVIFNRLVLGGLMGMYSPMPCARSQISALLGYFFFVQHVANPLISFGLAIEGLPILINACQNIFLGVDHRADPQHAQRLFLYSLEPVQSTSWQEHTVVPDDVAAPVARSEKTGSTLQYHKR